jgi:hypothetical protein
MTWLAGYIWAEEPYELPGDAQWKLSLVPCKNPHLEDRWRLDIQCERRYGSPTPRTLLPDRVQFDVLANGPRHSAIDTVIGPLPLAGFPDDGLVWNHTVERALGGYAQRARHELEAAVACVARLARPFASDRLPSNTGDPGRSAGERTMVDQLVDFHGDLRVFQLLVHGHDAAREYPYAFRAANRPPSLEEEQLRTRLIAQARRLQSQTEDVAGPFEFPLYGGRDAVSRWDMAIWGVEGVVHSKLIVSLVSHVNQTIAKLHGMNIQSDVTPSDGRFFTVSLPTRANEPEGESVVESVVEPVLAQIRATLGEQVFDVVMRWRGGDTAAEIANDLGWQEQSVLNRISNLRVAYGRDAIPYHRRGTSG